MEEDETSKAPTFVERSRPKRNRSLRTSPHTSREEWPANLGELLEWYTNEVEDVTRAAQLRLRDAAKVIADHMSGKIDLDEAGKAANAHFYKWRDILPGGIEDSVRGKGDEEVNRTIEAFRKQQRAGSRERTRD